MGQSSEGERPQGMGLSVFIVLSSELISGGLCNYVGEGMRISKNGATF